MAYVETQEATVFRGGGRRYFTRASAYNKAARVAVRGRKKRECPGYHESDGLGGSGFKCDGRCWYDARNPEFYERMISRVARLMRKADENALPRKVSE